MLHPASHQVVGSRDGVDVACQVQVERLHGNDLAVTATRCTALDAESRALARLTDASEDLLAQMRTKGLAKTNGSRALSLAQRGRVDASHNDHVACKQP